MEVFNSKLREEIIELREEVFCYKPGKASAYTERVNFPENLFIDGKRGYGSEVAWNGEIDEDEFDTLDQDLDLYDSRHQIGCAVIVFSARHDIDVNTTGLTEVIAFLHAHQGRYPVAVITHVDVAEEDRVETLRSKLRERGVRDLFEVANLTYGKPKLEDFYQLILLKLIARCMAEGDETLILMYCRKKEQERMNVIEGKHKKTPGRWAGELEPRLRGKERRANAEGRKAKNNL